MKFWNTLRVNRDGPVCMLLFQGGFFLFGVALVVFINRFLNDEPNYGCMGSIMAALGILAGVVAGGTGSVRFRLAVMMGQPRRGFLLWDTLSTACKAALGWLVSWGLCHLETALYGTLYPGYTNDLSMMPFFKWSSFGMVVLAVCVLDLAIGAIQTRFGNRVMAVLWLVLCFSPMLLGQAVNAAQRGRATILSGLGSALLAAVSALSPAQWLLVLGAVLLAAVGLSVRAYWDAEVRS